MENKVKVVAEEDYGLYKILDPAVTNPKTNKPYNVFTPYKKHLQNNFEVRQPDSFNKFEFETCAGLQEGPHAFHECELDTLYEHNPEISVRGGRRNGVRILEGLKQFAKYSETRDFPSMPSTKLSAYLHFTTVSIREVYHRAAQLFGPGCKLIDELYWR